MELNVGALAGPLVGEGMLDAPSRANGRIRVMKVRSEGVAEKLLVVG
jgi:hypothetical protein